MFKKILCLAISLLILLSAFVFPVFAENTTSSEGTSEIPSDVTILEILPCTEGSTSLTVGTHEYSQALTQCIELKPNVGYHIYGVEIDGVFTEVTEETVNVQLELGKKVSLRPVFRGNVIFNVEQTTGGKITPEGKVYIGAGKVFDVTATPDQGYICTGIYVNDVGLDIKKDGKVYKGSFKAPKEKEYSVYATFEPVETYTVTLNKNEGGKVLPFNDEGKTFVQSGDKVQFQAIPDEGYGIKSIIVDGKSVEWSADGVFSVEDFTGDFEVSIEFVQMASIPVSIKIAGKGKVTPAEKAYANTTLVLDVKPDSGNELVSIKINDAPASLNKDGKLEIKITDEVMALGTLKIDVVFDVIAEKFIIRTVVQNSIGGVITADGYIIENMRTEVRKGSDITLTFTPDMNYVIEKVKVDGIEVQLSANNTFTLKNVKESHGIIAYFIPDIGEGEEAFKVSVNASNGGTVSPATEQIVKSGQSITFTLVPDAGYEVDYVLVNGDKKEVENNTYTIENVIADQTFEVVFKESEQYFEGEINWNASQVIIDISHSNSVNSSLFNEIKEKAHDKTIIFKGSDFSWKFPSGYEYPSFDVDLSVLIGDSSVSKEVADALEKKMVESKIQGFDYKIVKTSGVNLNQGVNLILSLGSDYIGKELDYLFYDTETGKFSSVIDTMNSKVEHKLFESSRVKVDTEGKAEVPYDGHEYLILVVSSNSRFIVNVISGMNGSVSPRGTTFVAINTDLTIQITPDPGYKIGEIIVNGTSSYEEHVGKTSSVAITLGKITNDNTVQVSFVPSETQSSGAGTLGVENEGGLKPWVVAIIIIGIAIAGGVVLFIYKWNEEKDIVD